MRIPASLSCDRAPQQVEEMIRQGTAFVHVEEAIDAIEAPEDEKAALWLFAWSRRGSPRQRGEPRPMRVPVGTVGWGAPR